LGCHHSRSFGLLALTLDLTVPPLTILAVLLMLLVVVTGIDAALIASFAALIISVGCLVGCTIAVLFAWLKYGRDVLPPRVISLLPSYILGKASALSTGFARQMTAHWVGTDRTKS